MEDFKRIIDKEYVKINKSSNDLCQIYANLIQIKIHAGLQSYRYPIYVDMKKWIDSCFKNTEFLDYGYDTIPVNKFIQFIEKFPLNQRLELYRFLQKRCNEFGLQDTKLGVAYSNAKFEKLINKKNPIHLILFILGNNIACLLGACIAIILILFILMHPANCSDRVIFKICCANYCGAFEINLALNLLALLAGVPTENPILTPVSTWGVVLYSLGKLIMIILIVNTLFQKIQTYIDTKINN